MKSKILSMACLALLMMACEPNTPDDPPTDPTLQDSITHAQDSALKAQLLGVWNVTYTTAYVHSLVFSECGKLLYRPGMSTSFLNIPNYSYYQYAIEKGKLILNNKDTINVDLQDSILVIKKFGDWQFKKATEIAAVPLSESSKTKLDSVYSSKNPALYNKYTEDFTVRPDNYLDYANNIRIPEFYSEKHTLIFANTSCYSREGMKVSLYYNPEEDYFEFIGEVRKVEEGETRAYPYGIFDVPFSKFPRKNPPSPLSTYKVVRTITTFEY